MLPGSVAELDTNSVPQELLIEDLIEEGESPPWGSTQMITSAQTMVLRLGPAGVKSESPFPYPAGPLPAPAHLLHG